ncbi:Ribokinase-like protein [Lasiosphaeria miniovina]|uniref:Ribokinase n=1 Tax=Lasiosphaeria miniovina TaxID=1954250 RepID=A0AA40ALT6_9PEZI|nr:Ribokinase-like protein [Lasiosphaeria miniovina]KAK0718092.1 Ribokinase-like protein [Lasiosphaeria miniovina]
MAALPRITVLGSLNMDLVAYVSHHPAPGETMTADKFATSTGGKGANQAVACAKLSRPRPSSSSSSSGTAATTTTAHVGMVGCVGDDSYGALLRGNLARHGVDVSGVDARAGLKTGVALIVVDAPSGENRIILSPEANHAVLPDDAAVAGIFLEPESTKKPDLLIMQLEIPLATVLAALARAREAGVAVLLNPAPAQPLPAAAYAGLAHLVVNETEAALLGGVADSASLVPSVDAEKVPAALRAVARAFVAKGVRNVVATLGSHGVFFLTADGRSGLVPAEKVAAVVDTTAAGDTFVGAYALEAVAAAAAGREFDVEAAVRKANRAAARTVERAGAQDSIPWRDELV